MIKAIIVDNAGVLINTCHYSFYKKLANHSAYNIKYITKHFEGKNFHIMEMSKITIREYFDRQCKQFKIKGLSYDWFKKNWVKIFKRNKFMEKFVRKNHKKYKIWMLTNTNSLHYNYLKKKFPIYNFVKNKVISYKIRMAKPDKNIYRYALKKIKLKPKECLFIDNRRENIVTANKLGIKSIWYTTNSKFNKALKRFRIR